MLSPRLGHSLAHKVLVLVGASQLDQQNLIGNLRCGGRQPLFKLQHLLGSVRKGLREQGFKRGEWMRVSIGILMQQGQHSLERLFRGSELLHALKLCLSCCYVTHRATPFAQTHPATTGLYLFPDTPQTLEAFRQLRASQRTELRY